MREWYSDGEIVSGRLKKKKRLKIEEDRKTKKRMAVGKGDGEKMVKKKWERNWFRKQERGGLLKRGL